MLLKIVGIKPPNPCCTCDQFYWAFSNSGTFMVKSAYKHLHRNFLNGQDSNWNLIWKWRGPQRIRTFLWLAVQWRLKCKAEVFRRHIISDVACPHCNGYVEDAVNVLRDCIVARRIWSLLGPCNAHDNFINLPFRDWIMLSLKNNSHWDGNYAWLCIFGVAI